MLIRRELLLFGLLGLVAQGCGLRGPLYLPEPAKAVEPVSGEQTETDEEKKKRAKESSSPAPEALR